MKRSKALALLLAISLPSQALGAVASQRLFVSSSVKDFALAEEASYLLQCLSANTGFDVEFVSKTEAKPQVALSEDNGKLRIHLASATSSWTEAIPKEEVLAQCAKLELLLAEKIPAPAEITAATPDPQLTASMPESSSWLKRNKTWVLVAGGAAMATGAFFYWKSRQDPASRYGSVQVELP